MFFNFILFFLESLNVFIQRSQHPQAKVGICDFKEALKDMGKAYQKLSHAKLAELKREAVRLTAERNALLSVPVSDRSAAMEASGTDLRPSQVKRTYQKRLDISLHQVTGHNSWDHGFALSDHVCALKPSFVTPYIGK